MQNPRSSVPADLISRCPWSLPLAGFVFAVLCSWAHATGVITGTVSNVGTGNLLEGAKVEVPKLGLTVLSDKTGRFVISNVPAGAYDVVATYLGLDPVSNPVTAVDGQRAVRDLKLTTSVYTLQEFRVAGEREGGAAAITAERTASRRA